MELEEAALHASYELRQMVDSTLSFARSGEVAFLESALLHTRNMIEFFCQRTGSKITAGDFLPSWEPIPTSRFTTENRVLNNWLSHLTWVRVYRNQPIPDQEWNLTPTVMVLVDLFESNFVSHLPSDRQAWFSGTVTVVRAKLNDLTEEGGVEYHPSATTADGSITVIR
jgi:hypothetical protein